MRKTTVTAIHAAETDQSLELPLVYPRVSAGFPSPAENYFEERIDLNRQLIEHPSATFFVKVEGDSMIDAGIFDGDILIVDRSITPKQNAVVVAALNNELTVKRLEIQKDTLYLMPENSKYKPIPVTEETAFLIWGVVIYTIHKLYP